MKKNLKRLLGLLRRTWVWTLLALSLLALLIWFAGPLLAVAEHRILQEATSRLLVICVLVLAWGLAMALTGARGAARANDTEAGEPERERDLENAVIAAERDELRIGFQDAERVLSQSALYTGQNSLSRRELPWYLLIGPQASGKTSLLDFSGLDFPLNRKERRLTRDIRGTRGCDWYFADQAVVLDTAGRYFTQPQRRADAGAWLNLLALLRARRRTRPLDGVLVTLPVQELFGTQELRLEQLAATMRDRLREIREQLGVEVPVYLILCRADAVPGFDEFFEPLSREETEQVLGATFNETEDGTDVRVIRRTFDALLSRLNGQTLTRVHQERGTARRGLVLDFPRQLGRISHNLCLFVELAFAGNRYQCASRLRGYYLTRAPQVEFARGDEPAQDEVLPVAGNARLPVLNTGRARFIRNLLSRVIFAEAGQATLDEPLRRRLGWVQRAGFGAVAGVLLACGALWANGFAANHERLESLRGMAAQWSAQRSASTDQDELLAVLPALETLYQATQVFPDEQRVSLGERDGLYQGEAVNSVLLTAYHSELRSQLLPRLARQLERSMAASLDERDELLADLRAYLMLGSSEHRDRAWLQARVTRHWAQLYAGHGSAQAQLNGHFQRLLGQPFEHALDQGLVAQARDALRNESLAGVVYRALREQARGMPEYRLASRIGGQGAVLVGTDHAIPGFYTRNGYERYFIAQGASAITDILQDNWVLGDSGDLGPMALHRLLGELEQLYFRDYADHWSEALGRVMTQPFEGARQAAVSMAQLTAANSPVLQLLREVRDNTRFVVPVQAATPAAPPDEPAASAITAVTDRAKDAAVQLLPNTAKKALQRRFEALHRLLDEDNGPAVDLVAVLQSVNDVQQQLAGLGRSGHPEVAAFEMARARMNGQRDALGALRDGAARLPQPVGNWFNRLAEDSWAFVLRETYKHLNQRYQDEVYGFYTQALDKRYPFHAHSGSDVALEDFREFFKARGIAERFFETWLKPFVSGEPGRYRLRSVDGYSVPMSRAWLDQMGHVQAVRRSFFANAGDEPQVNFRLEPYTLDSAVSRAEFRMGDQIAEYRHGPVVASAFKWPATADGGRAALVLDRQQGRPLGIEKNTGVWSFFRLLELMETEPLHGRDVLMVKADVGGLRANYLLMTQRSPNPFDLTALRRFRLPAQL